MKEIADSQQAAARPTSSDFPILTGGGLTLRRVLPSDAAAVRDISYYDGVAAETAEQAAAMLARIEQDSARGESLHWGICLRGSNEIVGTCGFYRDLQGGVGEIGYVLREGYRGRGLMTAAVRLVLAYGFKTLSFDSIIAYTEPTNERSMGLLRRVGFVEVEAEAEAKGREYARRKFALDATAFDGT